MRIAVSGAHSQGKSTLVWDWVRRHPHYIREEEPFRVLHAEGYEIEFRQNCNRLHNGIQMYYNASRVKTYGFMSECVIFDRSPVDYIAYSQYTADYATTDIDNAFVEGMAPRVRQTLENSSRWKTMEFAPLTSPTAARLMPSLNRFIAKNDST